MNITHTQKCCAANKLHVLKVKSLIEIYSCAFYGS
jgi:hypothetical protein